MYTNQQDLKDMIKSRAQYESHEVQSFALYFLLFLSSIEVYYKLIWDVLNSSQMPDFVFRNEMEEILFDLEAAFDPCDQESLESGCITLLNF